MFTFGVLFVFVFTSLKLTNNITLSAAPFVQIIKYIYNSMKRKLLTYCLIILSSTIISCSDDSICNSINSHNFKISFYSKTTLADTSITLSNLEIVGKDMTWIASDSSVNSLILPINPIEYATQYVLTDNANNIDTIALLYDTRQYVFSDVCGTELQVINITLDDLIENNDSIVLRRDYLNEYVNINLEVYI